MEITGADLRRLRQSARMSLAYIADFCGCTRNHLSCVERNARKITPSVIAGYEQALQREIITPDSRRSVGPSMGDPQH